MNKKIKIRSLPFPIMICESPFGNCQISACINFQEVVEYIIKENLNNERDAIIKIAYIIKRLAGALGRPKISAIVSKKVKTFLEKPEWSEYLEISGDVKINRLYYVQIRRSV